MGQVDRKEAASSKEGGEWRGQRALSGTNMGGGERQREGAVGLWGLDAWLLRVPQSIPELWWHEKRERKDARGLSSLSYMGHAEQTGRGSPMSPTFPQGSVVLGAHGEQGAGWSPSSLL